MAVNTMTGVRNKLNNLLSREPLFFGIDYSLFCKSVEFKGFKFIRMVICQLEWLSTFIQ